MSTFCCWKAISSLMDSDVSNPHTITLQQRHVEELTLLWNPLLVQCVYGYNDKALIPILNFFFTLTHSGLTFSASITWLAFFSFYPLAAQHSSFLLHHNYFRQINGSSQSSFDYPWEYNPFHISCSYFLTRGSQTWDAPFPEKNCSSFSFFLQTTSHSSVWHFRVGLGLLPFSYPLTNHFKASICMYHDPRQAFRWHFSIGQLQKKSQRIGHLNVQPVWTQTGDWHADTLRVIGYDTILRSIIPP